MLNFEVLGWWLWVGGFLMGVSAESKKPATHNHRPKPQISAALIMDTPPQIHAWTPKNSLIEAIFFLRKKPYENPCAFPLVDVICIYFLPDLTPKTFKYLLRFGVLDIFWWSKYQKSASVWMSKVRNFMGTLPKFNSKSP